MENEEVKHKRRVRYSGTHPRRFEEKYKELNPEKYSRDIEHIISRGATPAGMHISIMVSEILEFLDIKPGQTGLDATLGYGGHTRAMLEKLQGSGHIYALDVDPIESAKTKKRLADLGFGEDILTVRLQNFRDIDKAAADAGKKFDFVLADLGVSSMQIDNPERGFSYKIDGPLDLRMNPQKGKSGAGVSEAADLRGDSRNADGKLRRAIRGADSANHHEIPQQGRVHLDYHTAPRVHNRSAVLPAEKRAEGND